MCFHVAMTAQALLAANRYQVSLTPNLDRFTPSRHFNGFQHPLLPAVADGKIGLLRWGLIPSWVKDRERAMAIQNQTLNAVSETVFEKASFKDAVIKRRCIVPVTGFYEWKQEAAGKVPCFIKPVNGDFFSVAGIWEKWVSPQEGRAVQTLSLLTCEANALMSEIHSKKRMPVILSSENEAVWLRPDLPRDSIAQMMTPFPDEAMAVEYRCGPAGADDAELL